MKKKREKEIKESERTEVVSHYSLKMVTITVTVFCLRKKAEQNS